MIKYIGYIKDDRQYMHNDDSPLTYGTLVYIWDTETGLSPFYYLTDNPNKIGNVDQSWWWNKIKPLTDVVDKLTPIDDYKPIFKLL